jgi:flagellar basal body-associated protein FliL
MENSETALLIISIIILVLLIIVIVIIICCGSANNQSPSKNKFCVDPCCNVPNDAGKSCTFTANGIQASGICVNGHCQSNW